MPKPPVPDFDAAIGLGSNIGDKAGNISRAIELLTANGDVRLVAKSRIYRSPPWGVVEQDAFANACITVRTKLLPHDLLRRCQAVEAEMGRVRHQKWGPRVIDVDILTYRNETIETPDLTVPHPFIAERAFVLLPLAEVAPDLVIDGRPVSGLINRVDISGVVPLASSPRK
jgi:2-amino-4-hydroxy-6-hydroxymethyldihydropteridine diphosphokinase